MSSVRPADRRGAVLGGAGLRRAAGPAVVLVVALAASVGAVAAVSGGSSALLVARAAVLLLLTISITAVVGVLATVALLLPGTDARRDGLLGAGALAAATWAVAAALTAFLLYLGQAPPIDSEAFGPGLVSFVADVEVGRTWLIAAVAAAVLTTLLVAVRSEAGVAVLGALTVVAAVPVALQSDVPGESLADGRTTAAAGLVLLVGAGAWLGALACARIAGASVPRILPVCGFAAVVAAQGTATPVLLADGAVTPPAIVGGVAVALAGVLAVLARAVPRLPSFRWPQLVLLALGSGIGVAAAMTRGLPEVPARTTPAEILTGAPLPPVPSPASLLGAWQPDALWLVVCGALLAGYLRAARRAGGWPALRSVSWIAGVALLAWLTSGGAAVYQTVLFEAHLLQHLGLLLVVPVLLAGGAPVRLLRAATTSPEALSGRIAAALESSSVRGLARPVPAAALGAVVVLVLYGSDALQWSVSDAVGTDVTTLVCLLVGALLVRALTARTGRSRSAVVVAGALLLVESAGAVALALGSPLLLADWFGAMGWGTDALAAQRGAAAVAWTVAAAPTLLLLVRALRSPGTRVQPLARNGAVDG